MAIALLAFADTSVLSRSYASGSETASTRAASSVGSRWPTSRPGSSRAFPISSSSSRTPVAEAAGSRTQLTGVVAAVAIGIVLVLGTGLLENIPDRGAGCRRDRCRPPADRRAGYRWLLRVNRGDFALAVASFVGVLVFGILPGVGFAVALSVLAVLERAWHPHTAVLGRIPELKGYHDTIRHPEGRQVPGLLLFRFDAPLFFANAEVFRDAVHRALAAERRPVRTIVLASEPITDVDSTAAEVLGEIDAELQRAGIELAFAEVKGPVKDKLRLYGLTAKIGEERFYPTIGLAVRAHVDRARRRLARLGGQRRGAVNARRPPRVVGRELRLWLRTICRRYRPSDLPGAVAQQRDVVAVAVMPSTSSAGLPIMKSMWIWLLLMRSCSASSSTACV